MHCKMITFFISSIFIVLLNCLCCVNHSKAANILAIYPLHLRSHYSFAENLLIRLAERGHSVTIYSPYPQRQKELINNLIDIDTSECFKYPPNVFHNLDDLYSLVDTPIENILIFLYNFLYQKDETLLKCPPLMELYKSQDKKFDLLITEFFKESNVFLYAHKFGIPVVATMPNVQLAWNQQITATPANPSYVKNLVLDTSLPMTFFQRMHNTFLYVLSIFIFNFYIEPSENEIVQNITSGAAPPMNEMLKNISIILINSHESLHQSVPLPPNVIPVGGIHINPAKKLPHDIEKFINESADGVIYFSMGSILGGALPQVKLQSFLYAFSKIPQRVLWKWDGDMVNKPRNVMTSSWMPQRDIFAHSNVKLFISHGGLLGTSEAISEGVPILGIPIFGDQRPNLKMLSDIGVGEFLDYNELDGEMILEKINKILNNKKYKENTIKLSMRFKDRPMSPIDTATYWTEYVIRHQGAHHLKTVAVHMPWYQYLLLDVIACIFFMLLAVISLFYISIKLIFTIICNILNTSKKSTGADNISIKLKKN